MLQSGPLPLQCDPQNAATEPRPTLKLKLTFIAKNFHVRVLLLYVKLLIKKKQTNIESVCVCLTDRGSTEASSLPAGRRLAGGRSLSALLRTAGSHWSAGSAWSPEEANTKKNCHGSRERETTSNGKITMSMPTPAELKQ